jgi:hypothetical protein
METACNQTDQEQLQSHITKRLCCFVAVKERFVKQKCMFPHHCTVAYYRLLYTPALLNTCVTL